MRTKKQKKQSAAVPKAKISQEKVQEEESQSEERGIPDVDFKKFLGCGG